MQVPSETKPALGAQQAAAVLAFVGFTWGGWTTAGTANKLADERADSAVVATLTPICVEKFQQSGDAVANLAALRKSSSTWEQGNFVEKGGWDDGKFMRRSPISKPDYPISRWSTISDHWATLLAWTNFSAHAPVRT